MLPPNSVERLFLFQIFVEERVVPFFPPDSLQFVSSELRCHAEEDTGMEFPTISYLDKRMPDGQNLLVFVHLRYIYTESFLAFYKHIEYEYKPHIPFLWIDNGEFYEPGRPKHNALSQEEMSMFFNSLLLGHPKFA